MKKLHLLIMLLSGAFYLSGQDIHSNDFALYVSEDSEAYLQISNSPTGEGITLYPQGAESPEITFNEGMNVIYAPLAENANYKLNIPRKSYKFITDGSSPKSELNFMKAPSFLRNDSIFFGKGLRINLDAFDELAGLNKVFYSLNSDEYLAFNNKISLNQEGLITLRFYSEDFVGNKEHIQTAQFYIDLTPPQTVCTFTGKRVGNTVSRNSTLILECRDNLSGVKEVRYVLNTGLSIPYSEPIPLNDLPDGTYFVNYFATDMVGNQKPHDVPESNMSFYVDNNPPLMKIETIGPSRQTDGITYISETTQIKIEAEDFRAGVENIFYGINSEIADISYSDPFELHNNRKVQYVSYRSEDKVGNISKVQIQKYTIDDLPPRTYATINNKVVSPTDTIKVKYGTRIKLVREDEESGILKTYYSIEEGANRVYVQDIIAQKNQFKLKFYSMDHTHNKEDKTEINFVVLPSDNPTAEMQGIEDLSEIESSQDLQLY